MKPLEQGDLNKMGQQLRSRIKEDFSQEDLDFLFQLTENTYISNNNDKANAILLKFRDKGFIELAPATNRYAVSKGRYVYKFALDSYGIKDNWNEFVMSEQLQPYATKTYETNGLITIAEYVNLISKEEFADSKDRIREILSGFADDYLFMDVGAVERNMCNWGFRDDDSLVILDYGYFYKKDPRIMHCIKDGGNLRYDANYDKIFCDECGKQYKVTDILERMDLSEDAFKDNGYKGPLKVRFGRR